MVLSTAGVRRDVQMSGLGTEDELCLRIIRVKRTDREVSV